MLRTIEFLGHLISKNEIVSMELPILLQEDDQEESDLGDGGKS